MKGTQELLKNQKLLI